MTTMEETRRYVCKGCGTDSPPEAVSDKDDSFFWFGAPKGTKDFWILMSNMRLKIKIVNTLLIPNNLVNKYDFFCYDCLHDESERLGREKLRWETF